MFRQKTTLIVGAGASCELNLPSGDGLKDIILSLLKPTTNNMYGFEDEVMIEWMRRRLGPNIYDAEGILGPIKQAAARIRRGLPQALSIDNFLHTHAGDDVVISLGKLAIGIAILRAEASSYLFPDFDVYASLAVNHAAREPTLGRAELNESWYLPFSQLLMSQIQRDNIQDTFSNIRFVIFNYDRCLEHYLWMALQAYFDISEEHSAEILSKVEFIHPYGSLGPLPWSSNDNPVALGSSSLDDLTRIPSRIRTFTESVKSDVGFRVKEAVSLADTLLILGFGYLDQNISLLMAKGRKPGQRVISTAYGVSPSDQRIISSTMMALGSVPFTDTMISVGKCRDLFSEHRLRLSLK